MSDETPSLPAAETTHNHAVARCCAAYKQAFNNARAQGRLVFEAAKSGNDAYRAAMPSLSSPESVRDFVACIAQGLLMDAISNLESNRLLYAAQVAISANRGASTTRKPQPAG